MRSESLTTNQVCAIRDQLQPTVAYLIKLEKRMKAVGFPEEDRLRVLTVRAREALQAVYAELHLLMVEDMGGPPKNPGAM